MVANCPMKERQPVESHARLFSYGQQTVKKDRSVIASMGAKAFFVFQLICGLP